MNPMPPIQCNIDLQNMILAGRSSIARLYLPSCETPPNMVAPVVVSPLIVSKKASVKSLSDPESKKGVLPNNDKTIQVIDIIKKASLGRISSDGLKKK